MKEFLITNPLVEEILEKNRQTLFPVKKTGEFLGYKTIYAYSNAAKEHLTTLNSAGLFDVSHLGLIKVTGQEAPTVLNYYLSGDVNKIIPNHRKYMLLLNEKGGIQEDLIVYKLEHFYTLKTSFLLCTNSINLRKVFGFLAEHISPSFNIQEITPKTILSLQGPQAKNILKKIINPCLGVRTEITDSSQCFLHNNYLSNILISSGGYTAKSGIEVFSLNENLNEESKAYSLKLVNDLFFHILDKAPGRVIPCGLEARNSLRTEAGLPLWSQELTEEITPLDAGLLRFVDLEKNFFIGKETLKRRIENGERQLYPVKFTLIEKGMPFSGSRLIHNDTKIGNVTSSVKLPSGKIIGLAYTRKPLPKKTVVFIQTGEKIRKAVIR